MLVVNIFIISYSRKIDFGVSFTKDINKILPFGTNVIHLFGKDMLRNEAKRLIALCSVLVILGWSFLTIVWYAPLFQDSEFDEALLWAQDIGLWSADSIKESPFWYITRAEAAQWYVAFAQSSDMLLYSDDICRFNDIEHLKWDTLDMVMLSCMYRFFWWSQWWYAPDSYLTKAGSLVALMKWFFPTKDIEEREPYREPFVQEAYSMGITKRESDPYMMYLVTKYELLLQLYRAWKWKIWEV